MAVLRTTIQALEEGDAKERRAAALDVQEGRLDRWIAIVVGTNHEYDAVRDRLVELAKTPVEVSAKPKVGHGQKNRGERFC